MSDRLEKTEGTIAEDRDEAVEERSAKGAL